METLGRLTCLAQGPACFELVKRIKEKKSLRWDIKAYSLCASDEWQRTEHIVGTLYLSIKLKENSESFTCWDYFTG